MGVKGYPKTQGIKKGGLLSARLFHVYRNQRQSNLHFTNSIASSFKHTLQGGLHYPLVLLFFYPIQGEKCKTTTNPNGKK